MQENKKSPLTNQEKKEKKKVRLFGASKVSPRNSWEKFVLRRVFFLQIGNSLSFSNRGNPWQKRVFLFTFLSFYNNFFFNTVYTTTLDDLRRAEWTIFREFFFLFVFADFVVYLPGSVGGESWYYDDDIRTI